MKLYQYLTGRYRSIYTKVDGTSDMCMLKCWDTRRDATASQWCVARFLGRELVVPAEGRDHHTGILAEILRRLSGEHIVYPVESQ